MIFRERLCSPGWIAIFSFERSMESLTELFGRQVVALQMPIGSEKGFRGVIDLVSMKAHL